jgi:hypothetical protein
LGFFYFTVVNNSFYCILQKYQSVTNWKETGMKDGLKTLLFMILVNKLERDWNGCWMNQYIWDDRHSYLCKDVENIGYDTLYGKHLSQRFPLRVHQS